MKEFIKKWLHINSEDVNLTTDETDIFNKTNLFFSCSSNNQKEKNQELRNYTESAHNSIKRIEIKLEAMEEYFNITLKNNQGYGYQKVKKNKKNSYERECCDYDF